MRDGIVWQPDENVRRRAQLTRFLEQCGLDSFDELYRRSVEDVAWFTGQVLRYLDIRFDPPCREILNLSAGLPWPEWCAGGGLNIAEFCVDRHAKSAPDRDAVVWEGEEGAVRKLSYAELAEQVKRCAAGLRAHGIGRGDAVGIHLPMMPETVVALLALARIGAIAVPLFSGFGPSAIASRLQDVGARALIACDAFPRRGRPIVAKNTVDEALANCPGVAKVFVVRRMGAETPMQAGRDIPWDSLMAGGGSDATEPTSAEDPLMVVYTSGTTGRPKGILHTHCGLPVKIAQDMAFGTDVGPGDRVTWITDIGWIMGPWLIYGGTLLGATVVLYDGAPDWGPEGQAHDRLWAFCARQRVNILGLSPSLIRGLAPHGDHLPRRHDLSALRILASTGEAWNPDPWWWLFNNVGGGRIPIINYSGGTEISGGILMSHPLLPIKPCSFSAPCLGIAADVVDETGCSVRGKVGELVIRAPWIGIARGFWNDRERYLETYWSRWPDVWVHGDWARIEEDGHWYILGRSDDTLKIAGKRVGPAEVESILVAHPGVTEAAVVGVPDEVKGSAMIAFCVPVSPGRAGPGLARELQERVAAELGKPLRPERVCFVAALPRTRNAKVMRRVIRAAWLGDECGDVTALENPAAVEAIRDARQSAEA
ncbi:MAG: AMP-binding protein [Bryobacteraceae bacterium]